MTFSINRRHVIGAASAAAAMSAIPFTIRAQTRATKELRLNVSSGDFGKAFIETYVKPFETETGVKVTPVTQNVGSVAAIALMVTNNNVALDLVIGGPAGVAELSAKDMLEKIDYSIYKKEEINGIPEVCRTAYSVAPYFGSVNMVYNTTKYPASKPRPANWAEFWDVSKFPGVRSLASSTNYGCWEEALLADGVPVEKLYPLDIERVFASLERIKPHVRKWWNNGAEIQQMLRDGAADLASSFDGRALVLMDGGAPIEISRNQAKLYWDAMLIPKGAPNAHNAQRFLEFMTRGDRQAAFAQIFPQAPSNQNAYKHLPDKLGRKLCSHPDYAETSYYRNWQWYAETGSDGKTNQQRMIDRWNQWILK